MRARTAFPLARGLPSTTSAAAGSFSPAALFGSFFGTTPRSDFPRPWLIVVCPWASRCALQQASADAAQQDAGSPGSRARCFRACAGSVTARGPCLPRHCGSHGVAFGISPQPRHPGRPGTRSPGAWITRLNTRPARTPASCRRHRPRHADERRRLPRIAAPPAGRRSTSTAAASSRSPTSPRSRPGVQRARRHLRLRARARISTPLMTAPCRRSSGKRVNRMLHVDESAGDLLNKLEAVRVLCQETGCAQRYLAHDALNALGPGRARASTTPRGTTEHRARFAAYLAHVQDDDLSLGIAMTDAKGDRRQRPHQQANPDTYVHIVERNAQGHRHLAAPRRSSPARRTCTSCSSCPAATWARRTPTSRSAARCRSTRPASPSSRGPPGRPGEKVEHGAALFSRRYGQSHRRGASSTGSSCPGSACSSPASGSTRRT